jgi:M6 family metalloprotease-like protein
MRSLFVICAALFIVFTFNLPLTGDYSVEPGSEIFPIGQVNKTAFTNWPRNINPLHALIVFTKFKGESPGDTLAPAWAKDIFNGQLGSINNYFKQVSFGKIIINGSYLPKVYELPADTTYYSHTDTYCQDIIHMLDTDPSVNLGKYDNDGLDGIPNSGDDDGFVDYIILMPRTRPYNFIMQLATGVMVLNMKDTFYSRQKTPKGDYIKVDNYSGCISTAYNKNQAIGTIVAEIGHAFGAVDLMDKSYATPEDDSAGAGLWCFLGHGALGWNGMGLPVGPCAYNRMLMNCIGLNNSNLIDLHGLFQNVRIKDSADPDGQVYRMYINPDEYFLIEYRKNDGSFYYDNQLPKSGILIWHIKERESNETEKLKLCDLECADGLYTDAGYPSGRKPDPLNGKDNLDFWAHDTNYATKYFGNLGDSTDVFDGVNFTSFGSNTNPNSNSYVNNRKTGVEIFNIRKSGNDMMFDCMVSPIPGRLPTKAPLVGLAFQRSSGINPNPYLRFEKSIYLMNFGLTYLPEILVTITNDTLKVQDITSLSTYETIKIIQDSMLQNESDIVGTSISKSTILSEEFEEAAKPFGMSLNMINGGKKPNWIQKVNLTTEKGIAPFVVTLEQNFPNPFNSDTTIPYILSGDGRIVLEVFNILGQKVINIDKGHQESGSHAIQFKADKLPTGLYFYRLRGSDMSLTRKLMIIR